MRVKLEAIGSIKPYPSNPRRDHDVDGIARSIQAFGFRQPLVVWDGDGHLMVGHGRLLAAKQLGLERVPVHHVSAEELSAEHAAAYRLADNRTAESSTWDDTMLLLELEALAERDRELAGFDAAYLDELQRRQELENLVVDPSEDEVPDAPAEPVSQRGDLWHLGDHLLLCGDATSADDVIRLGDHGHLMVADPPYGVEYDPQWRNEAASLNLIGQRKPSRSIGVVMNDERGDWHEAWLLFGGDVAYCWSASGKELLVSGAALVNAGFELRAQIIWRKQNFVVSRGHYHRRHEPCWYAVRKGRKSHWRGARDQSTVWDVANASAFGGSCESEEKTSHSTQKPVEVMRRPMLNNSKQGDLVYDPFVGSGTTIIAAETVGRRARCIELEPAYVDMSILRWQNFTGKTATHADGGSFEEVAAARKQAAA